MDQLRAALTWLKKQHFWVLSVLVALISMGCWWSAAGKLSKQFDESQTQIKSGFSSLDQLTGDPFHPNTTTLEKQTAEKNKQAENVDAVWKQLYDRQQANVLVWPKQLSPAFIEYVSKHSFGDDIPPELLENYQNYARRHFPELPERVHAPVMLIGGNAGLGGAFNRGGAGPEGPAESMRMGAPGGAPMPEDDGDYICQWLDQDIIREELNFKQEPTPLRIWITQEDLWVYHALLEIIAKTNEAAGASRMSNAAVRVIQSLEVGRRAAPYSRTPGRIYALPTMAAASTGVSPEGEPGGAASPEGHAMTPGPQNFSFEGGGGAMTPEQENANLVNFRYIDQLGQPIPFGAAAPVGEGAEAPAEPVAAGPVNPAMFGKEYKRLPVRMVLEMDQRWLQQLISECANQPLQVEVKEVRINPSDIGGTSGPGRSYSESGGAGGGISFPSRDGLQTFPAQPNVINVVIQGVIYIFNKPDETLLNPEAQPEAQMADAQ